MPGDQDFRDPTQKADPIALTRQLGQIADKRLNILRRIHETGSISEAARLAGVSYKAAWQALETLSNLAGCPLVEKAVGGKQGGGTGLTSTGLTVLELSERLIRAREKVLAEFAAENTPALLPVSSWSLKTSMRNQFPVRLVHIARGPAKVRLTLQIDEKNSLKASLTQESAQILGLTTESSLLALCKATAVDIAKTIEPAPSASVLTGTVIRTARQDKGGEITLRLPGGASVVGFARPKHGLKLGDEAQALVSSQAVVVALAE